MNLLLQILSGDDLMQKNKYIVQGELNIPISMTVFSPSKKSALDHAFTILNSKSIIMLDGEISTSDGKSHPIIAPKCICNWYAAK